jgi:hypothetical protein
LFLFAFVFVFAFAYYLRLCLSFVSAGFYYGGIPSEEFLVGTGKLLLGWMESRSKERAELALVH